MSLAAPAKALLAWRNDPVLFVRQALSAEPERWQAEFLRSINTQDRIAIKSGHGVGKSTALAWVCLWWLCTRYPAKIACTAPTAHQLEDVLWGEIAKWMRAMPEALRDEFGFKSDRLCLVNAPNESFAVARTARREQPEAFQGFHSANMLFIADEASGVDEAIFEVGQGAMSTKGAKTILTGNPTRRQGYFFEAFHKMRTHWHQITVSCADSKRVSAAFLAEMAEKYGAESDIYRVRVLGEFPRTSSTQFISAEAVESCRKYKAEGIETAPRIIGVDIARFGDDQTVFCERQGRKVYPLRKFRQLDTQAIAHRLAELIDQTKPDAVNIDGGGVGGGVVDRLKNLGYGDIVNEVAFGGSPYNKQDYADRRTEMWDLLRQAVVDGIELPDDSELLDDLTAPDYDWSRKDKRFLESKDSMKRRGLASPDCGDALALTYAVRVRPKVNRQVEHVDEFGPDFSSTGWMAA